MYSVAAILTGALLASGALAAPELIVDVDFNDEVFIRPEPMTEAEVETLVRDLHKAGADTVLLRMGFLGLLPYRTELTYPLAFDPEHARSFPQKRGTTPEAIEDSIKRGVAWTSRYGKVIEAFNPPEVFIRAGHELGMKVVIWLDIFDDGYPGYKSKFIQEHPHCQWTAKDGKTYFRGLISYAWPEARAFRVAQAKELLEMGADGIHCSTSAHCRHLENVRQDDFYGYGQPVVDEFQNRYGVDIRTADEFDKKAWHDIKGEFMNRLYEELAELCHSHGKQLWVGLQMGEHTHMAADPYFGANVVARYTNHWKQLADEGIADAFIVGDYEICSGPDHAYWKAKGLPPEGVSDLFAWAADEYRNHCKGKTKLYLFSEWLVGSPQALDHRMEQWAGRVLDNGFDGIDMHEAMNFEKCPRGMEILGRLRSRLSGETVAPLVP